MIAQISKICLEESAIDFIKIIIEKGYLHFQAFKNPV